MSQIQQEIHQTQQINQEDSEQNSEYIIQSRHLEWEKGYLRNFQSTEFTQICLNLLLEKFQNTISNSNLQYLSKVKYFIQYLKNQRKEEIEFDEEEMKILENNSEFKSLLINFHKSVGILIEIKLHIKNNSDFIDYFKQLDLNIQGFLYCMLEDTFRTFDIYKFLMKIAQQDDHVQSYSLQFGKIVYEKQQIIQKLNIGKKYFTILIIGAVGAGKSRLAQELLQELQEIKIDKQFIDGNGIGGVTKKLNRQQIPYGNVILEIIDTPGCGDMEAGLKFVFQQLTMNSQQINLVLFCMNAQILRLHREDICFLSIMQGIFKCNWEIFFICLNFMESVKKEDLQPDSIINSLGKRLEVNLLQQNLIIENNTKIKLQRIKEVIQLFIQSQNQNAFKLKFLPDISFIKKRLNQYKL